MSDDVGYTEDWADEATQCKNCMLYQSKDGKNACVPPDRTFESALEEYGEVSPTAHCNNFVAKNG